MPCPFFIDPLKKSLEFVGALKSGMDESITENKLKTDGIYAWVRNPMYSGWWMLITGISLMWHNVFLIPVFFINWGIMTIVLKNTEEKWLTDLYGAEYEEYKKCVNRCIPWKRGLLPRFLIYADGARMNTYNDIGSFLYKRFAAEG